MEREARLEMDGTSPFGRSHFCFAAATNAQFVHTRGKEILTADGKPLLLHGTNFGNWMVPEGYMWHFESGPQSTPEIEQVITELIGSALKTA